MALMSRTPGAMIVGATAMFGAKVSRSPFLRSESACSGTGPGDPAVSPTALAAYYKIFTPRPEVPYVARPR